VKNSIAKLGVFSALAMIVLQAPAHAHHVMGGSVPETWFQGLLSGLAHPVIGIDHLAALVGVGMVVALARGGVLPVVAFSAALIAGVGVHLTRLDLPGIELIVGLTTIVLGIVVTARLAVRPPLLVSLFAFAGLAHGYALGESIVGSEPSPLMAYLAGILIVQTTVSLAAYFVARRLQKALTVAVGASVILVGGVAAALAAGVAF